MQIFPSSNTSLNRLLLSTFDCFPLAALWLYQLWRQRGSNVVLNMVACSDDIGAR